MKFRQWPHAFLIVAWVAGTGCTALREIPRSEYAAQPERKHVRITTREGLEYEFDYARVEADTLVGFREREVEGIVPEVAMLRLPMDEIATLSVRGVDWYRSGLVGGGVLAAIVAAGLASAAGSGSDPGTSPGGGGRVP